MYSLTNGKLTFPNLATITTVRTNGNELINRKKKILELANRLEINASR